MDNFLITVIIVTYNHEDRIANAIESVLCQKTSYPYEIWIAEDCSTDGTADICREYELKYPGKIRLFAQEKNTNLLHLRDMLCKVHSKYFAVLDGDDVWCHPDKLQISVNFLESDLSFSIFAHDTIYYDHLEDSKRSLVHDVLHAKVQNPITLTTAPYLHTSARLYRNIVDFKSISDKFPLLDIFVYFLFLDKGYLYYYDVPMSVYNITGTGLWSKLNQNEQAHDSAKAYALVNEMLDYRYDDYFNKS